MDAEQLLLPHWATLKTHSFFARLAPELQANALAEAVAATAPEAAREIREWTPTTRRTVLTLLDSYLRRGQTRPQSTLWTARKGDRREVACVSIALSFGTELRLTERTDVLRTELLRDAFLVSRRADEWQQSLVATGWRVVVTPGAETMGRALSDKRDGT